VRLPCLTKRLTKVRLFGARGVPLKAFPPLQDVGIQRAFPRQHMIVWGQSGNILVALALWLVSKTGARGF